MSEAKSAPFTIINDGRWHEYEIDLSSDSDWTSSWTAYALRIDPGTTAGAIVEIDYIYLTED